MSIKTDFGERPFAAGTLTGLRAFSVDRLGRLIGPNYPHIFKPGENVAECYAPDPNDMGLDIEYTTFTDPHTGQLGMRAISQSTRSMFNQVMGKTRPAEHTLSGIGCECGFYAYYDGDNDYHHNERVGAIIDGYGVCTTGDRGFRAEKAKLVALIAPDNDLGRRADRVRRNYGDIPIYDTTTEAVEAHPLTDQTPTPETCEDFWTREVSCA